MQASWYSRRVILVGLTGGVATGKSTVARMFQDCGAAIIDADLLARQVVEPGRPAWRDIVKRFGPKILKPDRTIDREALAGLVFADYRKLKRLGAIIHPRVAREQAKLVRAIVEQHPHAVIIYDAPVLIEAGAHRRMDRVTVVTARRDTQIARLQRRNDLSRAESLRRIRSQMPLNRKRKLADDVIDGDQPLRVLRRQVARLFETYRIMASHRTRQRAATLPRTSTRAGL
ncbi:MAG: dephospho-CoA kinase [Nitrospiraceae bacterium]